VVCVLKVAVCGAAGKMGTEVIKAVLQQPDMELVGACDLKAAGKDAGEVAGVEKLGLAVETDLKKMLETKNPDVVVDFTSPHSVLQNVLTILEKSHAVVGTTGLTDDDLDKIREKTALTGHNAIVCPNFAIGAILMMHFAKIAVRFFPELEIIELHHSEKLDAPSGTAINGVRVHSIRLPGLVAHQEVIFGGIGQVLTIRHDSIDRSSFMPGVLLAIRRVVERPGLTYGLESILDI
jgi:4-hydroxy-tetrahydrodipicolinate reductase